MSSQQQLFIKDQLFKLALSGTAQRSGLYKPNLTEQNRKKFHKTLKQQLEILAEQYQSPVDETIHINNIEKLAEELSKKHSDLLFKDKMKIGHAQKALNLYLKYLWCFNIIKTPPPHLPIDSIILSKTEKHKHDQWTKASEIKWYIDVIDEIKKLAHQESLSLAEWELKQYNEYLLQ